MAGIDWDGVWFGDAVSGHWGPPTEANWPCQTLHAGPDCQIELRWADVARTDEARALTLAVVDVLNGGRVHLDRALDEDQRVYFAATAAALLLLDPTLGE